MNEELIFILEKIKEKITDDSDIAWTTFTNAAVLRLEIDKHVKLLTEGNMHSIAELNLHFLPTSTFQEHSISNGWGDEYLQLANKFDRIYKTMTSFRQTANSTKTKF